MHFFFLSNAEDVFHLKVQNLSLLFFGESSKLFVTFEESVGGWEDGTFVDAPSLTELGHNILLLIHLANGLLVSNVVESDNTVGDSLSFNELDPPNFSSTVAMGTTASFSIYTLNINNSE